LYRDFEKIDHMNGARLGQNDLHRRAKALANDLREPSRRVRGCSLMHWAEEIPRICGDRPANSWDVFLVSWDEKSEIGRSWSEQGAELISFYSSPTMEAAAALPQQPRFFATPHHRDVWFRIQKA
jgi:hypothetical protein